MPGPGFLDALAFSTMANSKQRQAMAAKWKTELGGSSSSHRSSGRSSSSKSRGSREVGRYGEERENFVTEPARQRFFEENPGMGSMGLSYRDRLEYQPLKMEKTRKKDRQALELRGVRYEDTRPATPPASVSRTHHSSSSRSSRSSKSSHRHRSTTNALPASHASRSVPSSSGVRGFLRMLGPPKSHASSSSSRARHSTTSRGQSSRDHSSASSAESRSTRTTDSRHRMSYDPALDPFYAHMPREPGQRYAGEVIIHRPRTTVEGFADAPRRPSTSSGLESQNFETAYENPFGDEQEVHEYYSDPEYDFDEDEYDEGGYYSGSETASTVWLRAGTICDGIEDDTVVPDDSISRACFGRRHG